MKNKKISFILLFAYIYIVIIAFTACNTVTGSNKGADDKMIDFNE